MTSWKGSPPHPGWMPGEAVKSPVSAMVTFDPAKLSVAQLYRLMISAIVPRPIALVSTVNPQGIGNLAPFSYFNAIASDPPCLMISFTRKNDGRKKDTLLNIESSRQFVVNTVSEWMAEPINQCSGEYPFGEDELAAVGLTALPSMSVRPSRVKESPVHFECEVERILEIGQPKAGSSTVVIGKILMIHADQDAYDDQWGALRAEALQPLARLGGLSYGRIREVFDLPRPKIKI